MLLSYSIVRQIQQTRPTCRLQPAELGSSSWRARGSDQSADWGSVKSSVSAGYFLWPSIMPPDLPPDSHLDGDAREGQQDETGTEQMEQSLITFTIFKSFKMAARLCVASLLQALLAFFNLYLSSVMKHKAIFLLSFHQSLSKESLNRSERLFSRRRAY